ncbi:MAG: hypothetical protein JWS12_496 [Candidatus Saccharibacteria bacterium]|nr:hypothetical protein [Candidatus Saccharibacteria bacterium]
MEIALFYIFIVVSTFIAYRNRRKTKVGVLKQSNNMYPYALGDYLKAEDWSFNGIDITLPRPLANFYLDSHKDSKRRGPNVLFEHSQKLALEGDFNTYFQLFVPKDSAMIVLSILSPNVMETLITSSQRFDVELHDEHLRIISLNKVYNEEAESSLITAAEALLAEINHRAKSWHKDSAEPQKLEYRKGATWKLASRYLRRSRAVINLLVLLFGIVGLGLGLALYYTHLDPNFSDPYSKGVFAGTMMYIAEGIIILAVPAIMFGPAIWYFSNGPGKKVNDSLKRK